MIRKFIVGLGICLSYVSVAFAEPSFDVSSKVKADIVRWQTHNGITSVKFLGKRKQLYKLSFVRDGSKGKPLKGTFWSNQRGELVKAEFQGVTTSYSPSDCSLTIGRCEFVETHSRRGQRKMIWNAKIRNGTWHYSLHHSAVSPKNLIQKGQFTVDEYGYYVDRTYQDYVDGVLKAKSWSKRIR